MTQIVSLLFIRSKHLKLKLIKNSELSHKKILKKLTMCNERVKAPQKEQHSCVFRSLDRG